MNNKLDLIERQGAETVGIMSNANQDLYAQRGVVQSIQEKNVNIHNNLQLGKQAINSISRQEYKQRCILYFAIFILFITDLALLIAWISSLFNKKWREGNQN